MIQIKPSPLYAGVFALAATSLALMATLLIRPVLEPSFFLLFLVAVLLSAWHYGRIGGVLATVASTLAVAAFFFPALAAVPHWKGAVPVISYALVSAAITWLTSAWRASRTLLSATLSSIGDAVVATDERGHITFLNPVAEALTGWRQREARGKPLRAVLRLVDENTRKEAADLVSKALQADGVVSLANLVLLISKDGAEIPVENSAAPVRDSSGKLRGIILVSRDVSGRRHLEEQLSHSQKMDAVGRLAGGVAGDFNNVLTVITGYSDLLRADLAASNPLRPFADEIMYAAERAAGLTRQLLAFSRGAAAQPKLVDLNTIISGMDPMLRRMLGDNIELIFLAGPDLGSVRADPAQIEQVIMNLATNARDAMPVGGKLVLETANVDLDDPVSSKKVGVKPGSYVMLAVSDTGVGMDAAVRSRMFEPFFTTKEHGKGSGLGLATVYGIVKQSEGQITVYSQVGCGTIVEAYLPRVTEPLEAPAAVKMALPKGSETILLVEDEDGVRGLVNAILHSHGYTVIEANNAGAALEAFEKNAHKIDLVLTDIVMPQMNGFELAQRLAEQNPELRILYMSGYWDKLTGEQSDGPRRSALHKPFTPDVLLAKVREVLDRTE